MKLKERDKVKKQCPNCSEPIKSHWITCPKCALSLKSGKDARPHHHQNAKRVGRSVQVDARSRVVRKTTKSSKNNGRYVELQSLCHMAQQMEEQALLGIPHESRVRYPAELAPYRPENLETWQEAAELGIPDGQYLLGKCLLNCGQADEGKRWLAEAAASEHLPARRELGETLLDLGQSSEGLQLLLQAAEGGDAYACEVLAYRYQSGEGPRRSVRKYRSFLKQAAALGNERAKLLLAIGRSR